MCFYACAHMPAYVFVEARGIFGVLYFQFPFLLFPFLSLAFPFLFISFFFPSPLPFSFPFLLFSVNLEPADLTGLADQHFPGIFLFLPSQH